ncbi:ATP-binding cassette domain-containing protein [Rhodobacter sphaeroides]|jgi:ABC-type dipeptide/oligopeptide/nickel transport system, ATPase component|uniref:ABC peptide/opine transporter, ATPase subunit n=1 Tax=Cereibacter sphaeroides (strain ATCC 17023 / DSM 158 / JCM 6121 / CCUG 31486 / LMG 2827 / NBRC 12203 / NCIMB 8253 / ATH 2.4.1.) TaxID=272943 RepID=Q3IXT7_CERS4|nr:ABC transporter ATP-binding protein [Cereibacter sphaeroides]ABA80647.1 ABC peptide/opine transporter, ATPase subunit [Cereibacter sphaeroides 2.4.1]AMJ48977.1 peptide ABC transporter ATP-binding protein [Cereibacter sphaeroides]ANS35693.1 peptide ABC transporter ATP-binding protein [Cereibacter sphaeroides]ATN64746.1 peptide ABC transporter ATP-binding protein [Cereibacter sphaeroides]AXC62940.1 ABC transporter ATP-binding protein [Cereibacter sphaeroides 2.4.1]
MTAVLSLKEVGIRYDPDPAAALAVRNVTLEVHPGETLGLVGESGSGKSSLAAAIAGLLPRQAATEGRVTFDGVDMAAMDASAQRRLRGAKIATIAQDPFTSLNPVVRIGRQLVEFQHWRRDLSAAARWARAAEMLARVGLSDAELRMRQYPHQLSGGIRQRVAIAAALLVNPRLLIADEPTTALDATTEDQIIDLIRAARAEMDGAVVFITHDMGVVRRLCDKVAILYAGELVEAGPVDAVFAAPRHPYTRALLACDPAGIAEPSRNLPTIPGTVPAPSDLPPGCIFAPRCDRALAICHRTRPQRTEVGPGRAAACHLTGAAA